MPLKLHNNKFTINDDGTISYLGKLLNRKTVGASGNFTTLKDAVDWFNASATTHTEILIDAGNFNITDTITVNNSSYALQIRGLGSAVTYLNAATGLTNKPMFDLKSDCDINKVTLKGSTLASWGTQTTENLINLTVNATSHEITDLYLDTAYIGIYDTGGADVFLFNYWIGNCATSGARINTTGSGQYLDAEVGTFYNNAIGIDLLKANTGGFFINTIFFENVGSQICIKYTGGTGNYVYTGICNISDCTYNNTGTFISGFDFSRTDGRDANIVIINNPGIENKNPHAKVNVLNNATTTTITAVNTWYKCNLTLTTSIIFDLAATAGTFTITLDGETTAAIAYNASAATIKSAIEALSIITTVTVTQIVASKEWTIRFDTANEGWIPMTVDIASLSTTTSYYLTGNTYTCKWKIESNKATYLPTNVRDVEMWIFPNVLCDRNNVRIDLAVAKYNSSNVLKGYFGLQTGTATAAATTNPVNIPMVVYIPDVTAGDYFELHALKPTNAGDAITISDMNWLIESK